MPRPLPPSAFQIMFKGERFPVVQYRADLTDYDTIPPETEAARRERLRARFAAILDEMGTLTDELDEIIDELEEMV
jgi:hypothetical protein